MPSLPTDCRCQRLGRVLPRRVEFHEMPSPFVRIADIVFGGPVGGAVGVLRAASDPRINALVALAGMVETATFAETEFGENTPDEDCMWDEPDCPLSSTFVNDMNTIGSVVDRAPDIHVPWLLVHGTVAIIV